MPSQNRRRNTLTAAAWRCTHNHLRQSKDGTSRPLGRGGLDHYRSTKFWLGCNHEYLKSPIRRQGLVFPVKRIRVWGESAVPYIVLAAMELEQHGAHSRSEQLITQLVKTVLDLNGSKGRGLPNPYYEPEAALRLLSGMDSTNPEIFSGHSYTLEALVEFLARRLLRSTLARLWEKITRVHFTSFRPDDDGEWFRWKAERGSLDTRMPNTPQSWSALLDTLCVSWKRQPHTRAAYKTLPDTSAQRTYSLTTGCLGTHNPGLKRFSTCSISTIGSPSPGGCE